MSLQVKVDVAGQIRLFKTVTFTDPYAFIEEALQNAQRAKATEVRITTGEDEIVISDNGNGLTDPESLFTMSKTGWDEDTVNDQSPFGLGFFSCVALADVVRVDSNQFYYVFDIKSLLHYGDTSIETGELDEPVQGFKVTLTGLDVKFSIFTFKEKVKQCAKFISELTTFLNDEPLEHIEYTKTDGSPYAYVIDVPGLKGWIRPFREYYEFGEYKTLKIFHQNRFVKDLPMYGISGMLLVSKNLLDFKAPDRKDIIQNEKLKRFDEYILSHIKKCLKAVIESATDDILNKYQDILDKYLTIADYKESMKYLVIDDPDQVKKIENKKQEDLQYLSISSLKELFKRDEPIVEDKSSEGYVLEETKLRGYIKSGEHPVNVDRSYGTLRYNTYTDPPIDPKEIPKTMTNREGVGLNSLETKPLVYYVEPRDLKDHSDRILQALQCKIPVIVIKNKLEIKVLKDVPQAKYLGSLEHKTVYKIKLKNPGIQSINEQRANRMFAAVSMMMGLSSNVFRIGDLKCTQEMMFGDTIVKKETYKESIISCGHTILIDRKIINKSRIKDISDSQLHIGELFFILSNLEPLAENLLNVLLTIENKTVNRHLKQLKGEEVKTDNVITYKKKGETIFTTQQMMAHIAKNLSTNEVCDWIGL